MNTLASVTYQVPSIISVQTFIAFILGMLLGMYLVIRGRR